MVSMPEQNTTVPRRVAILGSTGSIGTQALQVIAQHPDRFEVVALAAGANADLLAQQAIAVGAPLIGLHDDDGASALSEKLASAGHQAQIITGAGAAEQIAEHCGADVVLNGITGSIGLRPTLAALRSGADLALANKESLVVGGSLVAAALQRPGQVVPVDSEHSALAQALSSGKHQRGLCSPVVTGESEVSRLLLTASGGPFRGFSRGELQQVTPAQALRHPNFDMGLMVTTNSATLVNKALEVIEAHLLFDVPLEQIEAIVHPQQHIHSLVEYQDGSSIAQIGHPRMLVPIAWALSKPDRLDNVDEPLDLTRAGQWDFEPLDGQAFPAVALAKQAAAASATHMAVYNAANEQAVHAFHAGRLSFTGILQVVEEAVAQHSGTSAQDLDLGTVLDAETQARAFADELIRTGGRP